MSSSTENLGSRFPSQHALEFDRHEQARLDGLTTQLQAARAREAALRRELRRLSEHDALLARELDHRILNGLQMIASLLSLQSRSTTVPEAAVQLAAAACRVAALGHVHRRLHLLGNRDHVNFTEYLRYLCEELSDLLLPRAAGFAIIVEGEDAEISTACAVPLGFIVNELVTNSAKYARGNITVRFEAAPAGHSLMVLDDGPGLPAGFDPARSNGLGMKIVQAYVRQIHGELRVLPGEGSRGARCVVTFPASRPQLMERKLLQPR